MTVHESDVEANTNICLKISFFSALKGSETKACLREKILGEAYFNEGLCHGNHNSLQFSTRILVCTIMRQPSQFLILIGSKIIQHNKRKVGFKICFRVFKTTKISITMLQQV